MAEIFKPGEVTPENAVAKFQELQKKILEHPEEVSILTEGKVGNPITIGPRVMLADEWAEKMANNAVNASAEWLAKVQKPKHDPIEAAIKAAGKWKERMEAAIKDGKWAKAMGKVNKDVMYEIIRTMGDSTFKAGIEGRRKKIAEVIKDLQPRIAAVAATIDAMPEDTEDQRVTRMTTNLKLMKQVGKDRKGT